MAIVPLAKVVVFGAVTGKVDALQRLQALGCLHIEAALPRNVNERSSTRHVLAWLLASPVRRHAAHSDEPFDAAAVEAAASRIETRLARVDEEQRALVKRLRVLAPWGDYALDPGWLAHGLRLWFYVVPHWRLAEMPRDLTAWQVVARDQRDCWVAVIHPDEPPHMPLARAHTGSVSLAELRRRQQDLEAEHDDLVAERIALTRWCAPLASSLARLDDEAARRDAATHTCDRDGLFALVAWAPASCLGRLHAVADGSGLAIVSAPPGDDDDPPTLLCNEGSTRAGQALLGLFITPGYRSWDPSRWVLAAFTLFFGMVMADAGYALVMAVLLAGLARRRTVRACAGYALAWPLVVSTGLWGVAVGTWFGSTVAVSSPLASLAVLDGGDVDTMMRVALAVGVGHLGFACLARAAHGAGWSRAEALGWAAVLGGAALYGLTRGEAAAALISPIGIALAVAGFVVAVSAAVAAERGFGARVAAFFKTALRLSSALGDTLSYLRLFALAYAGASLAAAFNRLAAQVFESMPAFGAMLAAILLLLGHTLNLVLGVAGGFVHGLRLNVIEFLNWSGVSEGRPFVAFETKDPSPWMHPR